MLVSSRKLGEAAERLIDGSEKRICRTSSHVIEKRSNVTVLSFHFSLFRKRFALNWTLRPFDHFLSSVYCFTIGVIGWLLETGSLGCLNTDEIA